MAYTLPSLNALRAFEAAARHLSFTRAADELCVTQGAISRHIAILEESLGLKLFARTPRHVELTPAAETYVRSVRAAFELLDAATQTIAPRGRAAVLRVAALPTFASRWLLPRLNLLSALYPDLDIRLDTTTDPVNFDREEVDIAIEAAASAVPNVTSHKLLDLELMPICSPTLVNGLPPPRDVSELHRYNLLHTLQRDDFWSHWGRSAGLAELKGASSFRFASSGLMYQAAKEGLGVGIGIRLLLGEDLANGSLIAPFATTAVYPAGYYLTIPQARLASPHVRRFRDWILAEAAAAHAPGGEAQAAATSPSGGADRVGAAAVRS